MVVASSARGLGSIRVLDSVKGQVEAGKFTLENSALDSNGTPRVVTLDYVTPLRRDDYDIILRVEDGNGTPYEFRLLVRRQTRIVAAYVYPNPIQDEGAIYYRLTQSGDGAEVSIYTLTGRKIWATSEGSSKAHDNFVYWEGRDRGGQKVANGTYLVEVRVTADGEQQRAHTRATVMR